MQGGPNNIPNQIAFIHNCAHQRTGELEAIESEKYHRLRILHAEVFENFRALIIRITFALVYVYVVQNNKSYMFA